MSKGLCGGFSNTQGSSSNVISNSALEHSSKGEFTFDPKSNAVSRMKGGGHGQENIEFLAANGIKYNIVKTYPNGVRIGNVPLHKEKLKRIGTGQAWFPVSWTKSDIKAAGNYVANLKSNQGIADGVRAFGTYKGVRVGIIKTNGKLATIFPDADLQP